ncbi:unnamed protein product [Mytilus edulis]|uniref:Uncharacterized protein n=1 Tax=Mytilus edulis TaxID=6550 RepID=A0A8S3TJE9_MYTED|nr:unnamed protein product [Mytilus edulis]
MDDVASSTSQAVHENAIPHITALKLSTHIQDQFSRASTSSTATKGNTSQDDESHLESTDGNGITSSGMYSISINQPLLRHDFPLMTELASKLSPNMTRRPKDAETTFVGMPKRTKRVMSFLKRRQKEKEEGKEPLNKIGKPCGAGAVIYTEDHIRTSLKRPVASRGSILLAEQEAIRIVLEQYIYTFRESDSQTTFDIFLSTGRQLTTSTLSDIKESIGTGPS